MHVRAEHRTVGGVLRCEHKFILNYHSSPIDLNLFSMCSQQNVLVKRPVQNREETTCLSNTGIVAEIATHLCRLVLRG